MRIAIMQPYFMPYIGYWQLISAVDKFVIFDDVNYIPRGFSNRNYILMQGQAQRFTIPVYGASQNKKYNELYFTDNYRKFRLTLEQCYRKAPYFDIVYPMIDSIINYEDKLLSRFLKNSLEVIKNYLSIDTELLFSSQVNTFCFQNCSERIKNICLSLKANEYYNPIGGKHLYDRNDFWANGIDVHFLKVNDISYQQFKNVFVPNLSIIDVLMFNSVEDVQRLLRDYSLK